MRDCVFGISGIYLLLNPDTAMYFLMNPRLGIVRLRAGALLCPLGLSVFGPEALGDIGIKHL